MLKEKPNKSPPAFDLSKVVHGLWGGRKCRFFQSNAQWFYSQIYQNLSTADCCLLQHQWDYDQQLGFSDCGSLIRKKDVDTESKWLLFYKVATKECQSQQTNNTTYSVAPSWNIWIPVDEEHIYRYLPFYFHSRVKKQAT